MDHRANHAGRWWCKYIASCCRFILTWLLKTTAGKADRPALKADTLAEQNTGVPNSKA